MELRSDNVESQFRERVLQEAGVSYSLATALPAALSFLLVIVFALSGLSQYEGADWYRYLIYLLPQVCFAVTALVFFRRSKLSPRTMYRGCKWYYFPIALLMQFGLLFSLSELNGFFIRFLQLFGYDPELPDLPNLAGWNLLPALLVIALLPAVFEETLFRGIMLTGMRGAGWGTVATVFLSGALFSLFHHDPEQTLYQFVCGVCFALTALRAGSVFPSMLAHLCNNAVILSLSSAGMLDMAGNLILPFAGRLAVGIVSGVCLVAAVVLLILLGRGKNRKGGVRHGKKFFLAAGVGIALCGVQWIVLLVTRLL